MTTKMIFNLENVGKVKQNNVDKTTNVGTKFILRFIECDPKT